MCYCIKIKELRVASLLALMMCYGSFAQANAVVVEVLGEDGQPMPNVAVFIAQDGVTPGPPAAAPAVVDQVDTRFVPQLLVIQQGTKVEFPNSDVIAHHVYSFSKPNNFVLPLYKGDAHDPVAFEHDGVVTLGCNIHDQMLGYIVVVDTDVYGTTDSLGRVQLSIDDAATAYQVSIWNPRIRDDDTVLSKKVLVSDSRDRVVSFKLQKKLRAPHHAETDGVQWSEY